MKKRIKVKIVINIDYILEIGKFIFCNVVKCVFCYCDFSL